jgi:multimeric flavodoxin WrbA
MLRMVLDAAGGACELILLKDKKIKPCTACGGCFQTHKCVVADDMQELYGKLLKADVIVLACPTYFANVTILMKAFMDRCLPLYLSEKLKGRKVALLAGGNFKKGEVRFLYDFDIDAAMKDPAMRKELAKPVQRCLNIMKYFCVNELQMTLLGTVVAIHGDATSKTKELINLGKSCRNLKKTG